MYRETIDEMAAAADRKAKFLESNRLGYFVASALAGAYVGFGVILIYSIGAPLASSPARPALMGASFGVALSLVVFAGAELFTGNSMVMTCGAWRRVTTAKDLWRVWALSWVGNLAGAATLATLLHFSQAPLAKGAGFVGAAAAAKMSTPVVSLFLKAVLCNWLVCLAVWSAARCKTESGKLIMIFWCLFAFIGSGFEHSVANMTLLTLAMFDSAATEGVTWSGWAYNLGVVTIGNIAGGVGAVAIPYLLASRSTDPGQSQVQPIKGSLSSAPRRVA